MRHTWIVLAIISGCTEAPPHQLDAPPQLPSVISAVERDGLELRKGEDPRVRIINGDPAGRARSLAALAQALPPGVSENSPLSLVLVEPPVGNAAEFFIRGLPIHALGVWQTIRFRPLPASDVQFNDTFGRSASGGVELRVGRQTPPAVSYVEVPLNRDSGQPEHIRIIFSERVRLDAGATIDDAFRLTDASGEALSCVDYARVVGLDVTIDSAEGVPFMMLSCDRYPDLVSLSVSSELVRSVEDATALADFSGVSRDFKADVSWRNLPKRDDSVAVYRVP